ncbi:antitoxin Xre/MbcA/ParS toxin-binding domain-containing protein [Paraburkholderia sp. EG286B]|uniref:antitoxin Xre/MbcA/ParS toxin-binding domain-containing protein n=1 Tax=Paraburkholderia sp. EG286B TaxID=3237011 RepID=UPI0034D2A5A5
MLEYRQKAVLETAACICDGCGRLMRPDAGDGEWQERMSLTWRGGFASVFGHSVEMNLDFCQHCVKAILGEWIRVTRRDRGDGPPDLRGLMLAGATSSRTSVADAPHFDLLRAFFKATSEFVERNGLPLEVNEQLQETRSNTDPAGCVNSSVNVVSVNDVKASREKPSQAWRILRLAMYVWDDATDADAWLRYPHPELDGRTPYEAMVTDAAGAEQVEAMLGRILHGIPT